jgi:ATP-dependent 26S proteasome regulatory subunit
MTRIAPKPRVEYPDCYASNLDYLLDELRRLELLVHLRLLKHPHAAGPLDQFKGLVLLEDEILPLVAGAADRASDESIDVSADSEIHVLAESLHQLEDLIDRRRAESLLSGADIFLARCSQLFGLSRFDEQCLIVCLAAEVDRKFEKLYAYLQDDVTRKKPSVDLVLSLLCQTTEQKIAARSAFASQGPLVKYRLLYVIDDSPDHASPLISRTVKIDDRIASFLLGSSQIDSRLDAAATLFSPWSEVEPPPAGVQETRSRLVELLEAHRGVAGQAGKGIVVSFNGPYGSGRRGLARAICSDLGIPLIVADVGKLLTADVPFAEMVWLLGREASLQRAALSLESVDVLIADKAHASEMSSLAESIRAFSGLAFLMEGQPWLPQGLFDEAPFIRIDFPSPDFKTRRRSWEICLEGFSPLGGDLDTDALAGRFRLTQGQIRDAVRAAENLARWRSPDDATVTMEDLFSACRAQTDPKLGALARKIDPKFRWDDIVLPPDQLNQLREVCSQSRHKHTVYTEWGFDRTLSLGKGLTALFTGPPGTGKTMAAEVVANGLNLDLYKIDLSQVVSKYIGETEKQLCQIFDAAQSSNSILFFDEADALFGKRSEVKDAHDRYANIEVGYLLQKMEEYEGIAILATNLRQNLDEAFIRRVRFIIEFPFPDEEYRRLIWHATFPSEAPLAGDVDFDWLARGIKLAGGNIKNIALAAAFFAAAEEGVIRMSHVVQAARREFQKIGRGWSEEQPATQEITVS